MKKHSHYEIYQYFKVLELEPFAPISKVKETRRELILIWHPDRFQNNDKLRQKAEIRLRDINNAYENILDYHYKNKEAYKQREKNHSTRQNEKTTKTSSDRKIYNNVFNIHNYFLKRIFSINKNKLYIIFFMIIFTGVLFLNFYSNGSHITSDLGEQSKANIIVNENNRKVENYQNQIKGQASNLDQNSNNLFGQIPSEDHSAEVEKNIPIWTVTFQLEWDRGFYRAPVVQPLPNNISQTEITIRSRFEVLPDGSVGLVQPVTRGNPELDREVIRTLRTWRFSRLPYNMPQESQFVVVTFRFISE